MTELVVARLLLLIGEHLIRLVDLFELFFRLFIAGVQVGMILLRRLTIGFLYFIVRSAFVHA